MRIQADTEYRYVVEKSEFICYLCRCFSPEEAKDQIEYARRLHPEATHVVHAYRIGESIAHSSDDREPAGTAGMPIREALEKAGLTDINAVVVRYFGGVKLGTGGLARAYTRAAAGAIAAATLTEPRVLQEYRLACDYNILTRLEKKIRDTFTLVKVEYAAEPSITFRAAESPDAFISEWTSGKYKAEYTGDVESEIIIKRPEKNN